MLKGEKIYLRPMKNSDKDKTLKWKNNLNIRKMALYHPFPITDELESEQFDNILTDKNNKDIYLAICLNGEKKLVGFTTLRDINWVKRNCEAGCIIGERKYRGQGIGKETTLLLIKYAFDYLNLHKIYLKILAENKVSIHLAKKLNFKQEGLLKEEFFWDGKYWDVLVLGMVNDNM